MRWLVLFVVLGWCVNGVAQRNDMKRDTLSVVQILSVAEPIPGEFLQMIDEAYTQWNKHMILSMLWKNRTRSCQLVIPFT